MLDPSQLSGVEARLRAVEARTGVQVVVAAIERADVYHGLRWRAFALGAAASGLLVSLGGTLRPAYLPEPLALTAVALVLGAGLLCALGATLSPAVARLFIEPLRAEAEVRQRAAVIFLERGLFSTRGRTAVLLLACAFERRAALHADSGFGGRVAPAEWRAVEDAVIVHLRAGRTAEGLLAGLGALERLLAGKGFNDTAGNPNELPDRPLAGPVVP